jgi:uncharacterized protein (TIGR03435 family)
MRQLAISIVVGVALAISQLSAQEVAFDVASVKVTKSRGGGWKFLPSGDVIVSAAPLGNVIALAFDVPWRHNFVLGPGAQQVGLPEYPHVDIHAKGNPVNDPRAMLRTLLRERFGLRMHRETREVAVYALTVKEPGTLGRWLQPSPHNCREFIVGGGQRNDADSPRKGDTEVCWARAKRDGEAVGMSAGTIGELISQTRGFFDRPVIDATGLSGNFTWEMAGGLVPKPGTIFSIFEEQLGLKFERRMSQAEVFVIDDVRMPTPN